MEDHTQASIVEVIITREPDGTYRVWVNVDGVCQFRAYRVREIEVSGSYFSQAIMD